MSINLTIQATNLTFNSPNGCLPDSCWFKYTIIQLLGVLSILIDSFLDTIQRSCLISHSLLQCLVVCIDGSLGSICCLGSGNSIGLCLNSSFCQICNSCKLIVTLDKGQECSNGIINGLHITILHQEALCRSVLHQLISSLFLCIIGNVNCCQLFLHSIKVRYLLCQLLLELINLDFKL